MGSSLKHKERKDNGLKQVLTGVAEILLELIQEQTANLCYSLVERMMQFYKSFWFGDNSPNTRQFINSTLSTSIFKEKQQQSILFT